MDDDTLSIVVFWGILVSAFLVWLSWSSGGIVRHGLYQISYGVSSSDVIMPPRPKDCDFWTAPLGRKNCSYETSVFAVDDGGKEFLVKKNRIGLPLTKGLKIEGVHVYWKKVPD